MIIHVIACFVLIISILLQASKGGGLAGIAGGGAQAGAVFGSAGAGGFLAKATTYLAIVFFLTCIGIYYTSRGGEALPETAAEQMMGQRGPMPMQGAQGVPQPLAEQAAPAQSTATPAAESDKSTEKKGE
jgi:preprotein translocase subunit SecG